MPKNKTKTVYAHLDSRKPVEVNYKRIEDENWQYSFSIKLENAGSIASADLENFAWDLAKFIDNYSA